MFSIEVFMSLRPNLGDFSSIVCFKAVVVGAEETLGAAAAGVTLKAAGRKRGQQLVKSLGLTGAKPAPSTLSDTLNAAIGKDGTRLCHVVSVTQNGDNFNVKLLETICSAGEPDGSQRQLTFTLGAVHGALEALYEVKLKGKQVGSVLRGGQYDELEFVPL